MKSVVDLFYGSVVDVVDVVKEGKKQGAALLPSPSSGCCLRTSAPRIPN